MRGAGLIGRPCRVHHLTVGSWQAQRPSGSTLRGAVCSRTKSSVKRSISLGYAPLPFIARPEIMVPSSLERMMGRAS